MELLLIAGVAACAVFSTGSVCDSGQTQEEIDAALADKLIDAIWFEGGTARQQSSTTTSPQLVAHEADTAYPQVSNVTMDPNLGTARDFQVELATDFGTPDNVTGAVAYFERASKYQRVTEPLDAGKVMHLIGHLREGGAILVNDAELVGKSFDMKFALTDKDGNIGNIFTKTITVLRSSVSGIDGGGKTDAGGEDGDAQGADGGGEGTDP
jgi:hypothetical protein